MNSNEFSPKQLTFLKELTKKLISKNQNSNLFILIQNNSINNYLIELIQFILHSNISITTKSEEKEKPTIQELLNKFIILNLNQIHTTKLFFDEILNHFSNWSTISTTTSNDKGGNGLQWNSLNGKVENWDKKLEGIEIIKKRKSNSLQSNRKNKRSRVVSDDEEEEGDDLVIEPRKDKGKGRQIDSDIEEDEEEEEESESTEFEWSLSWSNRSLAPPKEEVPFIKDTLDHFHDSLRTIFNLGKSSEELEKVERGEAIPIRDLNYESRRWIILNHGEKLHDLANNSSSTSGGGLNGAPKETGLGMTFAASIHRLSELTALPISTITLSKVEWSKAREGLVGLKDPIVLTFPALEEVDVIRILSSRFLPLLPTSDKMDSITMLNLFKSLVKVVHRTFNSLVANDLDELAHLTCQFWPKWLLCVEKSNPPILPTDEARLTSHLKSDMLKENLKLTNPRISISKSISLPISSSTSFPAFPAAATSSNSTTTRPQASTSTSSTSTINGSSNNNAFQGFSGTMPSLPVPSPIFNPISPFPPSPVRSSSSSSQLQPLTPLHRQAQNLSSHSNPSSQPSSPTTIIQTISSNNSLVKSLPIQSKYLLLAAFYSAFNPTSSDVQNFVKLDETVVKSGKGRKLKKRKIKPGRSTNGSKVRTELGGGKTFTLERMLAIFEALLDSDNLTGIGGDGGGSGRGGGGQSIDVLMQVTTLINLRLLQKVSNSTNSDKLLDGVKLKSKLTKDNIDLLAKSIGKTDWMDFLYDADR